MARTFARYVCRSISDANAQLALRAWASELTSCGKKAAPVLLATLSSSARSSLSALSSAIAATAWIGSSSRDHGGGTAARRSTPLEQGIHGDAARTDDDQHEQHEAPQNVLSQRGFVAFGEQHLPIGDHRHGVDKKSSERAGTAEEPQKKQQGEKQLTEGTRHRCDVRRQSGHMILGPEEIERTAPRAELEPARFPELPAYVEPSAEQHDGTKVIEQTAKRRVSICQLENELHTETPWRGEQAQREAPVSASSATQRRKACPASKASSTTSAASIA